MKVIGLLLLAVYIACAIALFLYVGKKVPPSLMRAFLRASVLALFFACGVVGGHGVGLVPVLLIIILCLSAGCAPSNDTFSEFFLWVLVPVAIQWAILVSLFMAWHAIMSFWNKRSLS